MSFHLLREMCAREPAWEGGKYANLHWCEKTELTTKWNTQIDISILSNLRNNWNFIRLFQAAKNDKFKKIWTKCETTELVY